MSDWAKIGEVMNSLAKIFYAEWKVTLPSHDTLPSEELDRAVSTWCLLLARNLREPIDPPEIVRPWIVVRLLCAGSLATGLARNGDTDAPELDEKTLRQLLIGEWHGALRDRWALLLELGE